METINLKNIEANEVYFKFEPIEAIELKKELLEAVADILKMQIIVEENKKTREDFKKSRVIAKKSIDELKKSINETSDKLPMAEIEDEKEMEVKINPEKKIIIKKEEKKIEKKKATSLEEELLDIQKKLDTL